MASFKRLNLSIHLYVPKKKFTYDNNHNDKDDNNNNKEINNNNLLVVGLMISRAIGFIGEGEALNKLKFRSFPLFFKFYTSYIKTIFV